MKYLSLFSGVGGFELGINKAYERLCIEKQGEGETIRGKKGQPFKRTDHCTDRFTCIGFSEIDKYATKVYKHHFPNHKEYGDITTINGSTLPDFDLLVGGFPCQSFSVAGRRGGFNDTRGTLFFEIARIVREKQPRFLLLENVKGLLSHDKGSTFTTIISTLDELGYDCQWQVLNSKDFGVPQNRERIFIVGHIRGTPRPEVFPIIKNNTGSIQQKSFSIGSKIRKFTPIECERLQGFPDNWTGVEGMSDTQRYKQMGNAVTVNVVEEIIYKLINKL